jgi:hypothetical protein
LLSSSKADRAQPLLSSSELCRFGNGDAIFLPNSGRAIYHYGHDGAGKSSALGEASDILAVKGITHAAIDLDSLGLALLPSAASSDGAMYRNLQSVCENYSALGVN